MGNERIEKMLYDAKEKLPTTNAEWRISDMTEERVEKKKFRMNKAVAACIACVLFLGVGGVTVLANMEIQFDSSEYGQWAGVNDKLWKNLEWEMNDRGFILPENISGYPFNYYSTTLVVKHGTTYLEALMNNVYNPIHVCFDDDDKEDGIDISISVGPLDEAYWNAYFEFEKVDDMWVYKGAEEIFEYGGMQIYGKVLHLECVDNMGWRWIDEKNGICWCVYVPINTGMEGEVDSMEVVKEIIDLNK